MGKFLRLYRHLATNKRSLFKWENRIVLVKKAILSIDKKCEALRLRVSPFYTTNTVK